MGGSFAFPSDPPHSSSDSSHTRGRVRDGSATVTTAGEPRCRLQTRGSPSEPNAHRQPARVMPCLHAMLAVPGGQCSMMT